MPIYHISESKARDPSFQQSEDLAAPDRKKGRLFSLITTRALFVLLLVGDIGWVAWIVLKFLFFAPLLGFAYVLRKRSLLAIKEKIFQAWLSLKRAAVCGISLLLAIFSPSMGIMVACTYFLMYDKGGIPDLVPQSLQDQFKDFFKEQQNN